MRIDLVGTTADFRGFGPPPSLPINHLLCENPQTAGRIGEDGLVRLRPRETASTNSPAAPNGRSIGGSGIAANSKFVPKSAKPGTALKAGCDSTAFMNT